ncbi:MAG: hypothetical protein NT079_07200, partial [Candidatus Omnitrophica bacterium]|nr:hypothetical protein [Candidatus Omnitrophota bacterium]
FVSKFVILKAALDQGHYALAVIFLASLAVIFIGAARIFIPMAQGAYPENLKYPVKKEEGLRVWPAALFFIFVLILGIYISPVLNEALQKAAKMLGGC